MSSLVIALTGGVASGKSAVEKRFIAHAVGVYDADRAAREVVAPGGEALAEIRQTFGAAFIRPDGALDRGAMRQRVFDDPPARKELEAIVHPGVRHWLAERARADSGDYCVLSIPLLAENHPHYAWVDRVLVVDVPEAVQMQRLMARDGIDEPLARKMIQAQASRAARLAIADDVIDNGGAESNLDHEVAELHRRYRGLAAARQVDLHR